MPLRFSHYQRAIEEEDRIKNHRGCGGWSLQRVFVVAMVFAGHLFKHCFSFHKNRRGQTFLGLFPPSYLCCGGSEFLTTKYTKYFYYRGLRDLRVFVPAARFLDAVNRVSTGGDLFYRHGARIGWFPILFSGEVYHINIRMSSIIFIFIHRMVQESNTVR